MISLFKKKKKKSLESRIALVTGASRGLGAAIARKLAQEGAHVILLARTIGALEEVDDQIRALGGTATLLPFDLADTQDIPKIATAITEKFKRLDILVGNAALLGPLSPVALSNPGIYEEVFKINFFANYHLIRTLDPLLRGSKAGRAIFVTSGAAHMHYPFWSAYAASKAALENMVSTYAAETSYSALKVNIINPGTVRTAMRAEAFPSEDPLTLPTPDEIAGIFAELASETCTNTGALIEAAA